MAHLSRGEELRIVNEITGAEKGQKLAQPSLIPHHALMQIAEVYGFGAGKYARFNWRKGYNWSLSIDAMERHWADFVECIDYDEESGLLHLAHCGWHILTLLTFVQEHPELDDRWRNPNAVHPE